MALTKDPVDIDRRPPEPAPAPTPPQGGLELRLSRLKAQVTGLQECGKKLDETSRSLQRTHATLPETRPLTGRQDSDEAVAGALNAFPWALTRIVAGLGVVGTTVEICVTRFDRANAVIEEEVRQCGDKLEE